MTRLIGSVSEHLSVQPDAFFDLITDVHRLSEWNETIDHVVEAPDRKPPLPGDEWVVEVHAMGTHWNSRARIEAVDEAENVFSLRSQTDDGNPSFALWTWRAAPVDGGSDVTVSWEVNPKTFWRRFLLSRIRHRQLKQEVRDSLHAAERLLRS